MALALGVDKFGDGRRASSKDGLQPLSPTANIPLIKFALLTRQLMQDHGLTAEDLARVAVKNHGNAALNPYAQFRKPRTLEQVLASPCIAGALTGMMCTPRGEGAAAVIVASAAGSNAWGWTDNARCACWPRCRAASAWPRMHRRACRPSSSWCARPHARRWTRLTCRPGPLDLIELHDAFSIEELVYAEAIGACAAGDAAGALARGEWAIGGRCAVNASGGLIAWGIRSGPPALARSPRSCANCEAKPPAVSTWARAAAWPT